jgi:hypothetical protein
MVPVVCPAASSWLSLSLDLHGHGVQTGLEERIR